MAVLYGRVVSVSVAGLTITAPKIVVDIKRDTSSTPTSGQAAIFGLSRRHEHQIEDRKGPVVVQAGYEGAVGTLFDGSVQRVERDRERLARVTRIYLGDMSADVDHLNGVTNHIWQGEVPLRDILRDLVTRDLMLGVGVMDAVPADVTLTDWKFVGTTTRALSVLLDGRDVKWHDDDGVIQFESPTVVRADTEAVDLNPSTGLVGAPSKTDDGARARSLMNARLRIGNTVRLSSEAVSGSWKIVGTRHHGSNWDGDTFYSEVDLREA